MLSLLTWDEDEASRLIKDAFSYLCEDYLKAGKPDFDPAAVYAAYERVDKAYKAEDMSELRSAILAFVAAQLTEFLASSRS